MQLRSGAHFQRAVRYFRTKSSRNGSSEVCFTLFSTWWIEIGKKNRPPTLENIYINNAINVGACFGGSSSETAHNTKASRLYSSFFDDWTSLKRRSQQTTSIFACQTLQTRLHIQPRIIKHDCFVIVRMYLGVWESCAMWAVNVKILIHSHSKNKKINKYFLYK